MYTWLHNYVRYRISNDRGQAEVIVFLLLVFLIYLLVVGRRVVVQ